MDCKPTEAAGQVVVLQTVIHLRHLEALQVNQKKIKTRRTRRRIERGEREREGKMEREKKLIVIKVLASPQKEQERRERLKGWPMIWTLSNVTAAPKAKEETPWRARVKRRPKGPRQGRSSGGVWPSNIPR